MVPRIQRPEGRCIYTKVPFLCGRLRLGWLEFFFFLLALHGNGVQGKTDQGRLEMGCKASRESTGRRARGVSLILWGSRCGAKQKEGGEGGVGVIMERELLNDTIASCAFGQRDRKHWRLCASSEKGDGRTDGLILLQSGMRRFWHGTTAGPAGVFCISMGFIPVWDGHMYCTVLMWYIPLGGWPNSVLVFLYIPIHI